MCATSEAPHLSAEQGWPDAWSNLPESIQREMTALSRECLAAFRPCLPSLRRIPNRIPRRTQQVTHDDDRTL